jgi:hypothetical protein
MSLDVNALIADDQARLSDGISAVREYYNIKQALTNPNITEDQKWQMSTMLNDMRHSGRFNNLNRIYDHARQNGIILEKELSALEGDLGTTGNVWDVIKGQLSKSKDKVRLDPFTTGVIGALDDLTFGAIKNNYYDASTEKAANVGRWVGTGVGLALPVGGLIKGLTSGGKLLKSSNEIIKIAKTLTSAEDVLASAAKTIDNPLVTKALGQEYARTQDAFKLYGKLLDTVKQEGSLTKGMGKFIKSFSTKSSELLEKAKNLSSLSDVSTVEDIASISKINGREAAFNAIKTVSGGEGTIKQTVNNLTKELFSGSKSVDFMQTAKSMSPDIAKAYKSLTGSYKDVVINLLKKGPLSTAKIAEIARATGNTKLAVASVLPHVMMAMSKKHPVSQHAMNTATPPSMDMSSGGAMDVSIWMR